MRLPDSRKPSQIDSRREDFFSRPFPETLPDRANRPGQQGRGADSHGQAGSQTESGGFPGTGKWIVGQDQPPTTERSARAKPPLHSDRPTSPPSRPTPPSATPARALGRRASPRGQTPADILEICGRPSTEQNPVVAALLRLHQTGDPDAGVVLLTVIRPMIKAVVRCRNGHLTDEVIDNYWSAASHLIGSTTPTGNHRRPRRLPDTFIRHLGNRLHQHARDLAPSERRWREPPSAR